MTIEVKANQAPRAEFKENDLSMIMNMDLTFRVKDEVAIIVTVIDLNAHVEAMLNGANLTTKVDSIKMDKCSAE